MDLSNSADLTMFEESQELRPLSRSSSMGFCHSEPDTDFEDLGLPDETNFTLRLDTLRSKLLGEEFDEIEDGLDFPDDLANYGNNSFITEKSRACAIERQLPQSHGDTPELGLKQHQNILLLKDSGNSAPASTKSRNLNTISLADFQNSITNGPKPTQTLPVVNFNNFGDELIVSGNHWDMNTTEVQKNISTSSSATLHSRRSTKMSALDAKSNDADDLDNISDFDVDAETDISNRVLYSTAIAEKLANLKESENDDLLVEDNPIFAPKSTPNPKQMSVRVNATKSRNTISIFQPVSLRNPQPVKASNSNFSKPPLKSSRISAEHLPRSSPPFKEKVKGVVTSRKPTYKVVFGRTILIEQPKSKSKKAQTKPTLIRNLSNYDQPKG